MMTTEQQPKPTAQALAKAYGFAVPQQMGAFRVWHCMCTHPSSPQQLTLCPRCRGTKREFSVP